MSKTIYHGQIVKLERMNSSVNGNPRYRVILYTPAETFIFRTQSDSSFGYSVANYLNKWGDLIVNERGIITDWNF